MTPSEAECRSRNPSVSLASWSIRHRRSRRQYPATSVNTHRPRHDPLSFPALPSLSLNSTSCATAVLPSAAARRNGVRSAAKKHDMFHRHTSSGNRTSHSLSQGRSGVVMILLAVENSLGRSSLGRGRGAGAGYWAGSSSLKQCGAAGRVCCASAWHRAPDWLPLASRREAESRNISHMALDRDLLMYVMKCWSTGLSLAFPGKIFRYPDYSLPEGRTGMSK